MINLAQKVGQKFVNSVFNNVHTNYDKANDAMSLFMHRKWKKDFISMLNIKPESNVLDIACGSGDITKLIFQKTKTVIGCDINEDMLSVARGRLPGVQFQIEDAQSLSFGDASFDFITCSFGIRNFQEVEKSIAEMTRVLKKSGTLAIMEFMPNANGTCANGVYRSYIKHIVPKFDVIFRNDVGSYKYLSQSILAFQTRAEFKDMLEKYGFSVVTPSLCGGSVGVFLCIKN